MCDEHDSPAAGNPGLKTVSVHQAAGMVLAHDITEIRPGEFKGRAFKKGQVIRQEDICHLQRLGKEHLFVLHIGPGEMHENDAARALARALAGPGVAIEGEPREGKINLVAAHDGLLRVDREALRAFNMLGDVMCATLHDCMPVKQGQLVAGTRAIPLVVKNQVVEEAVRIAESAREDSGRGAVLQVKQVRKPRVGVVITGNEVYHGRIKDAFAPVITKKIEAVQGEITGVYYAPDDAQEIQKRLRELLVAGADLLITTGGMSVDPDDVTRFAIRELGATDIVYGSAVLPGAMVLVGYIDKNQPGDRETRRQESGESKPEETIDSSPRHQVAASPPIPVIGIPACGMYHKTTVFDLILPRILAGEKIGRRELAELGHGGLCMNCPECRYPVCPFGKE